MHRKFVFLAKISRCARYLTTVLRNFNLYSCALREILLENLPHSYEGHHFCEACTLSLEVRKFPVKQLTSRVSVKNTPRLCRNLRKWDLFFYFLHRCKNPLLNWLRRSLRLGIVVFHFWRMEGWFFRIRYWLLYALPTFLWVLIDRDLSRDHGLVDLLLKSLFCGRRSYTAMVSPRVIHLLAIAEYSLIRGSSWSFRRNPVFHNLA